MRLLEQIAKAPKVESVSDLIEDKVRPILRWAGSKYRMLDILAAAAPRSYQRYFEPFAGSACLFLKLDPNRAVLGDVNSHLIGAYRTIRSQPVEVHTLLCALPRTTAMYYRVRAAQHLKLTAVERAARFVYLNQFCFNGVYRENRAGQFNVPIGRKFRTLPHESEYIEFAERLAQVDLRCADFTESLQDVRKGDFVYLDPPYAKRGARNRGEYGRGAFTATDVTRLVDTMTALNDIGAYVLASFFNSASLRRQLHDWHIQTIGVGRSVAGFVAKRGAVRELLIRNYVVAGHG